MGIAQPLQQVTALGTQTAMLPLRLVEQLTEPVRDDLRRDIRRSLGVPADPTPPVTDPRRAFLDPNGVARKVHADLPSMIIGGLSALLLQTLHPLAMAGVAEHSNYAEDPTGRLRRTAAFVGATTFGTTEEARRAIDRVKRIHLKVHGISPDGRPYTADDPDLVTWIHVAEMTSFLHAAQRYGPVTYSAEECDAYFDETAIVADELGAEWVPHRVDEVEAYLTHIRPQLYAGAQAREARNFLLRGVARKPEDRAVYAVIAGAAVSLLPRWARSELGLPNPPLFDQLLIVPPARALCAALRWAALPPSTSDRPAAPPLSGGSE